MFEIIYAVNKNSKEILELKSSEDTGDVFDGSLIYVKDKFTKANGWSVFNSREQAEYYVKVIDLREAEKERLEEERLDDLRQLQITKEDHHARLMEAKRLLLKEFRLRTLHVEKSFLKKVMFSVTGNKQFKKILYDPANDDDVLKYITAEELDEVFIVLNVSK